MYAVGGGNDGDGGGGEVGSGREPRHTLILLYYSVTLSLTYLLTKAST